MRQWLTITAGGLCLTLASSAHALGVGEPQQVSPLNRPLHVLLPLTDGAGLEPAQISVAIADDAAYRQSGLSRSALIDALSAKVVRQNGSLMLVIDSPRRVREPFLDLLLVVTWPEGQWQRDVSLLFDPVDYASSQPLVGGDRAIASSPEGARAAPGPVVAEPLVAPRATAVNAPTRPVSLTSWPAQLTVRTGDSLSSLAASLLPRAGMSRQALMVALFEANPAAFVSGDINRLRAGVNLDVPPVDAVIAMPRGDAVATFQALARETDDGRPVIDIVGRDVSAPTPESAESLQLAALERRLTELAAETERQRAAIVALQAERDGLQGALAAAGGVSPDAAGSAGSPTSHDVSAAAVASSSSVATAAGSAPTPSAPSAQTSTPALTTRAVASPAVPASAPTPSLWQRLLEHIDWIGGGLLIVLLVAWAWQRRRGRHEADVSAQAEASVVDTPPTAAPSTQKSSGASTRRVAAAAVDVDSATISQADIYMAYGRHAEARDWLRQQLAEGESAQLRLGLLRALGELRDLDGLEEALAGFGDDATAEQRREAQALVDDYRARHVEESWEAATAEVEKSDSEVAWSGGVEDIDALFESQVTAPPARAESPVVARRDVSNGETEPSPPPMSALFDDELKHDDEARSESEAPAGLAGFDSIDYVAPTLDVDARPSSASAQTPVARADVHERASETPVSSAAMPAIDFSALSILESALETELDPADEPALGAAAMPAGIRKLDDRPSAASSASGERRETTPTSDSEARSVTGSASAPRSYREVPAGWDVEEVEFQSPHRDNSRP